MITHLDHVTVVVEDVARAKEFFGLLGFEEDKNVTISGEKFAQYMNVPGIKAEHHTLVLKGSSPRMEIQLLKYIDPKPIPDPNITTLREVGYNHICFAVDDIESELKRLTDSGIKVRNEIMEFHDRNLVYLVGPEDITVELAEWV
jgi:catechol 2,3-dioxygenase-like lactoylglutathione lyase family enzyme